MSNKNWLLNSNAVGNLKLIQRVIVEESILRNELVNEIDEL